MKQTVRIWISKVQVTNSRATLYHAWLHLQTNTICKKTPGVNSAWLQLHM